MKYNHTTHPSGLTSLIDTSTERILKLEERVKTLELLINDVMHQLDAPSRSPSPPKKQSQKQSKPKYKAEAKPKYKAEAKPKYKPSSWSMSAASPPFIPIDLPPEASKKDWKRAKQADAILALAKYEGEVTKQQVIDTLGLDYALVGTLIGWLVNTKRLMMCKPTPTAADPDPKKVFRVSTSYKKPITTIPPRPTYKADAKRILATDATEFTRETVAELLNIGVGQAEKRIKCMCQWQILERVDSEPSENAKKQQIYKRKELHDTPYTD